jgi:hypothetical protein
MNKNIWSRFKSLNPEPALFVGVVSAYMPGNTTMVILPSGARLFPTGEVFPIGTMVFVQDNKILRAAPDLLLVELEL